MKKIIFTLIIIATMQLKSYSQSTVLGNVSAIPPESIGWLGGVIKPLDINNSHPAQPINFYTGGIAPATQRMVILGTGANAGFVGIGANFPAPASLLHIDATNNATGEVFPQPARVSHSC